MTDEQLLLSSIMRGYDRYTRPVYNASSTVNVKLGLTLVTIFDFVSSSSNFSTDSHVIISCNNISGHNYIFYDEEDGDFNMTDEQAILSKLMWSYDRHTRPVLNASHAVKILLGITLNQIFDVVSGKR